MTRFVMARKRSARIDAKRRPDDSFKLLDVLHPLGGNVKIFPGDDPWDDKEDRAILFEADPKEVEAKLNDPQVWIEPQIFHWPQPRPRSGQVAAGHRSQDDYIVHVVCRGQPIEGAGVRLMALGLPSAGAAGADFHVRTDGGVLVMSNTDEEGFARFSLKPGTVVSRVIVSPVSGHWEMIVDRPTTPLEVECEELPFASDGLGWWHKLMGIESPDDSLGRGIRIGVIDTGVAPHPALKHVTPIGSWIDGDFDPDRARDVENHGTHVCGIIGARPPEGGYRGIAPAAEVFVIRVFDGHRGATQQALRNAVRSMVKNRMHLINVSMGASERSQILSDEIYDARDAGCLCICAAGNSNGEVLWPARFDGAVAVTAIGMPGEYPTGSLAADGVPNMERHDAGDGRMFAHFSCHGPEVRCCGPGVGIISTIPAPESIEQYSWAAMNGTSMAAPAVCGILAARLAQDSAYAQTEGSQRAEYALQTLISLCQPTKLAKNLQGEGLPILSRNLSK